MNQILEYVHRRREDLRWKLQSAVSQGGIMQETAIATVGMKAVIRDEELKKYNECSLSFSFTLNSYLHITNQQEHPVYTVHWASMPMSSFDGTNNQQQLLAKLNIPPVVEFMVNKISPYRVKDMCGWILSQARHQVLDTDFPYLPASVR